MKIQDDHANPVLDDDFIILFNAHEEELTFEFPEDLPGPWTLIIDTSTEQIPEPKMEPTLDSIFLVQSHSLAVLRDAR